MRKRIEALSWTAAVIVPVLLFGVWKFVPYPGVLLAAGAVIGGYIGFILYEHAYHRTVLTRSVVIEQLAVALLLLVLFSFSL